MSQSYFITTAIPYVNSKPHLGHAQEFLLADAISRFHRSQGRKVLLQSGTDDNAFKNVVSARQLGIDAHEFVHQNALKFKELLKTLEIQPDYFVRTSSIEHSISVQSFLSQLPEADVYESTYSSLYCQGCEDFLNEADLKEGVCPDHKKAPDLTQEENVFFRLSQYQEKIFDLIDSDRIQIEPRWRKKEILKFISSGLRDISLSRNAARSSGWGIPFPGKEGQVVYVWIDALINYISGVGFGRGEEWKDYWNEDVYKVHVIGKNVWKFHAIYWIGLLLSAKLPLPNEILIHGFLTENGEKISKSLGNGIDPTEVIRKYGSDALRFYLLTQLSRYEDADFSEKGLVSSYHTELANKFGNLVSRVLTLRGKYEGFIDCHDNQNHPVSKDYLSSFENAFEIIGGLNQEINNVKPWELLKEGKATCFKGHIERYLKDLGGIKTLLEPVLPLGTQRLNELLKGGSVEQLYPRVE